MGLNMYLTRINRDAIGYTDIDLFALDKNSDLYKKLSPYIHGDRWPSLYEEVGYWRKANAIHKWFEDNIDSGVENCRNYEISKAMLEKLLSVCEEVVGNSVMAQGKIINGQTLEDGKWVNIYEDGLIVINSEICEQLLPTTSGFFFGSTNYDEYYIEDVKQTITILRKVLNETDFDNYKIYYCASW